MPVLVNLRHLEDADVHLEGELSAEELELNGVDELIRVEEPLRYELDIERANENLLVSGKLSLKLRCECIRCLQPFQKALELSPWDCFVPLEGEEKAPVENDCVDLTPWLREDTLLAFPQHPLCKPDCNGLPAAKKQSGDGAPITEDASAWAVLNKLNF